MSKPPKKKTIGLKVLAEELPTIHKVARRLGYKNLHSWLDFIFRREYSAALAKIVSEGDRQP